MVASPPHASAHPALAAAAAEHDEVDDDTQSWAPAPRDVCAELLAKHKWSRTAESTQITAVLTSITEMLDGQGLQTSPVALYAALVATLQQTTNQPEVQVALMTVLASVLPQVPQAAVRSRYQQALKILTEATGACHKQGGAAMRAAVQCLGLVLRAVTADTWEYVSAVFAQMLQLLADPHPKIRKEAVRAVCYTLQALADTPVAAKAGEAVVAIATQALAAPALAARAATGRTGKERATVEAEVTRTAAAALHCLFALKRLAPLLPPPAAAALTSPLLEVFSHGQPVLAQHAVVALTEISAAPGGASLEAAPLSRTLGKALKTPYEKRDLSLVMALQGLLQQGMARLHSLDPELSARHLAAAVHTTVAMLASPGEGVVFGAAECLKSLLRSCLDARLVQKAVQAAALAQQEDAAAGPPSTIASVAVAIESALGYRYRHVWTATLPLAALLVERLGGAAGVLLPGLLASLGEMAAVREKASWPALQATLGTVLRIMGPERVLAAMPLNLESAVADDDEEDEEGEGWFMKGGSNLWLLGVMRANLCGSSLGFFFTHLLPLCKRMAADSAAAAAKGDALKAQRCATAEYQLWATLPAFCHWSLDTAQAFPSLAKEMGAYLTHRADLRTILCASLDKLLRQNKAYIEGVHDVTEAPASYTRAMAQANLTGVAQFAKNFLPIFFNLFVAAAAEHRGALHACVDAFAQQTDAASLGSFFRTIMRKYMKVTTDKADAADALLEGGDSPTERRCTFLHLLLTLFSGLNDEALHMLYKAAKPAILEKEGAVQKKAYRVLLQLCTERPAVAMSVLDDLHPALVAGMACCTPSARRNRLRCVGAVIGLMGAQQEGGSQATREKVSAFVSEIVLGVKEVNTKTRHTAFELLVKLAREFESADEEADEDDMMGGAAVGGAQLQRFFTMVMSGLAGATTTMVGATIFALARLLFEFSAALIAAVPDLLPAVLLLIKTHNRETVKAVLGFVRVVCMRLPEGELAPLLPSILEATLVWAADDKNRFRMKIRILVERMLRRCGEDAVKEALPEGHERLLAHIRKAKAKARKKHDDARSVKSGDGKKAASAAGTARTARRSEWRESILDGGDEEEEMMTIGGVTRSTRLTASTMKTKQTKRSGKGTRSERGEREPRGGKAKRDGMQLTDDTMDLLDETAMKRAMGEAAAGSRGGFNSSRARETDDFDMEDGKLVIKELKDRKRGRGYDDEDEGGAGGGSDDAADDDRRSRGGKSMGGKSMGGKSMGGKSMGGKSAGGKSAGGRSSVGGKSAAGGSTRGDASAAGGKRRKVERHAKEAFKPKKKGTGGDLKTADTKVEPYAYWQFDAKMMNRRATKQREGKKGLSKLVQPSRKLASQAGRTQRAARKKHS